MTSISMRQNKFDLKETLFVVAAVSGMIAISAMQGCAGLQGSPAALTMQQSLIVGCDSVTKTIDYATANADKLTDNQRVVISHAIETISPICDSPTIPTADQVKLDAINGVILNLANAGVQ